MTKYLTSTSGIVALMTLEHQARMTNLIMGVSQQFRRAWNSGRSNSNGNLDRAIEELVQYMLFADEARIREPIKGVFAFTTTFPQRGPHDRRGRSLRDFDLQTRLFRYPLSYMVYSEVFDAFAHLSSADRQAISEILHDTKPGLP